jgi:DNA-directed RNA polymerase specialized sigma24 family protein
MNDMSAAAFGEDSITIAFNSKVLRAIRAELAGDTNTPRHLRGELVAEMFATARLSVPLLAKRRNIDEYDLESEVGERCMKAVDRMLREGGGLPRVLAAYGRNLAAKAAIDVWRRGDARARMQEHLEEEARHYGTGWSDDRTGFEMRGEVAELLSRMTPEQRVMLCYPAFGFEDREIAEILGIAVNALQVRRHRWIRKNRNKEA